MRHRVSAEDLPLSPLQPYSHTVDFVHTRNLPDPSTGTDGPPSIHPSISVELANHPKYPCVHPFNFFLYIKQNLPILPIYASTYPLIHLAIKSS